MSEAAAQSLYVVSQELNATLNEARVALENGLEGPGRRESLQQCAALLHQARGVLKMVEIHGGALLAEEMEAVCGYLARLASGAKGQQDGMEALGRAIVQLPAYLERLLGGGRDIALVLLPMLNDLRAVRGEPLMSESTLLLLNLSPSSRVTLPKSEHAGRDVLQSRARELRPRFQLALLGWIKGADASRHLKQLSRVAAELELAADRPEIQQLWWVAGAVLEALQDGGLETSVSLKRLLGQADREIKRLIDQGPEAFDSAPPTDLLNNLLYYVARSRTAGGRVAAVRKAFNLSELLPGDEQVEEAREGLAAPSVKLMETVAEAIKEDIARVKDVLDIYVRTGMDKADELAPQLDMLKKISDTLGVLGLGDLRGDVQAEIERLRGIVGGGVAPDDETLLEIAATLLEVEDDLDRQLVRLIHPEEEDQEEFVDTDVITTGPGGMTEYQQVARAVMRECIVNLSRIKEVINQSVSDTGDPHAIDSAPGLVKGIEAGLLMLGKKRAGSIVHEIGEFLGKTLRVGGERLGSKHLERLADAVVSVEYYMETVEAGRRDPWYMLDNAESCLDTLRPVAKKRAGAERGREPAHAETRQMAPHELPGAPDETGVAAPRDPTQVIEVPVVASDAEHLDPELMELFIEEAKEELASIRRHLPRWKESSEDMEALITMRRSFHTLKGSGRMVGAERVGEYSWNVENLLNRLINRTLTRTPPMVELVEQAVEALPELIEQLESDTPPSSDVGLIMARAAAFAEGHPNAASLTAAPAGDAAAAPLEMDPVLLDIFAKETAGHLAAIKTYLEGASELSPPVPVTENLHRACHTLHGSMNMADVDRGVAVTAALNRYVRKLHDNGRGMDAEGIAALGESVAAIEAIVASINKAPAAQESHDALIRKLHALHAATEAAEEAGEEGAAAERGAEVEAGIDETAAGAAAESADEQADYDPEIAAIFTEEAGEILEQTDAALASWRGDGHGAEPLAELKRHLHTLKGGARMAGIVAMGDLSHELETLLIAIEAGRVPPSEALDALLQQSVDELHRMRDRVAAGEPVAAAAALTGRLHALAAGEPAPAEPGAEPPAEAAATREEAPAPEDDEAVAADEALSLEDDEVAAADEALPFEQDEAAPAAGAPSFGEDEVVPAAETPSLEEPAEPAGEAPGFEESSEPEHEPALEDSGTRLAEALRLEDAEATSDPAEDDESETFVGEGLALEGEERAAAAEEAEEADDRHAETRFAEDRLPEIGDDTITDEDLAAASALFRVDQSELLDSAPPPEAAEGSEPALADEAPEARDEASGEAAAEPEPTPDEEEERAAAEAAADESAADESAAEHAVSEEHAAEPEAATEESVTEPESAVEEGAEETAGEEAATEEAATEEGGRAEDEPRRRRPESAVVMPFPQPRPRPAQRGAERQEFARIDAELLENLLNAAGEVSIFHSRLTQQVGSIDFHLEELEQTVTRLREQLRKLEIETETQILNRHQDESRSADFDPLELDRYSSIQQLSRALAESANDVASLKDLLHGLTGEAETLLVQQSRVTAELQDGLMRTRMVPFERHVPRLTRLVRQVASETGKRAELAVEGGAGELDRQVLEKMLPPFEHMLRNAVVHGIEAPEERQAQGKPPVGRITVRLHREGSEMVIDVADDGAGLDVEAIRRKAQERGLLEPDARASDEEAMELILTPGFSTAAELTQSAGRGVGMDVVANEVKKLGGSLSITSMPDQGTNFTVRLPFTLAITQALVVRTGEETYALPLPSVEGIARVPRAELDELLSRADPVLEYGEQSYRFQHLGLYLGGQAAKLPADDSAVPVILVRAGEYSSALLVDEMLASREIVVKSAGPQLATVRGVAGATILGDGRVVLILDVGALVRSSAPTVEIRDLEASDADGLPLALVVDDSITVRRVTERLLKRSGMRVVTAKDGIDAISALQEEKPDVVLLDIEMPRMDGYEFASHLRNDEDAADVPIIMITSRVSDKHRARAIELGVNDYLGKPYQDTQLLEAIDRVLEAAGKRRA